MSIWPFFRRRSKNPALDGLFKYFKNFDSSRPVESYEYVVVDSELTGLNTYSDEMVSLAAIRIRDLRIVLDDCFFSYLKTKRTEATDGVFVHKITPLQSSLAPEPESVIPTFVDFCGDAILVGHFFDIDIGFLNRLMERTLGAKLPNLYLDTRDLASVLYRSHVKKGIIEPSREWSFRLDRLSREYKLPLFQEHDALGDTLQTAYLFLFLVDNLRSEGLVSLDQLFSAKCEESDHVIPGY